MCIRDSSITGAYLSGRIKIPVPKERRKPTGFITVKGARENNLKNIDVKIPLGIMTCITGVSGSGKSSLTNEILYKRLARDLNRARCIPGAHDDIEGLEQLDTVSYTHLDVYKRQEHGCEYTPVAGRNHEFIEIPSAPLRF